MTKKSALGWGLGIAAAAAVGAGAWFVLRKNDPEEVVHKIEDLAEEARDKAGGVARTLKEKATPWLQTIGDLVEKNAEVVSAIANVSADQVRRTGQEIKQAAEVIDKNLDALANI